MKGDAIRIWEDHTKYGKGITICTGDDDYYGTLLESRAEVADLIKRLSEWGHKKWPEESASNMKLSDGSAIVPENIMFRITL